MSLWTVITTYITDNTELFFLGISAFATTAAAISSFVAIRIAKNSNELARTVHTSSKYSMYSQLMMHRESLITKSPAAHNPDVRIVCDFFEHLCYEAATGKIDSSELKMYEESMKEPAFRNHAEQQNKGNPEVYKYYLEFLG